MPFDLFYLPFRPAIDANSLVVPGAELGFYVSGTNTPQPVYADAGLTTELENPVPANAAGKFPSIYIDNALTYRVRLSDQSGAVLDEVDPYIPGEVGGPKGDPGESDNTYDNLVLFKASDITRGVASLRNIPNIPDGRFNWTPGNFSGQADDLNIIEADSTALTVGAWVRQRASGVLIRQAGTGAVNRDTESKVREIAVTITDYGAVSGLNIIPAVTLALAAIGAANGTLTFPRGTWPIAAAADWSSYRNVTFRFEPGAVLDQGANAIVLPERVEMGLGAGFTGSGSVTQRNRDQVALAGPPADYTITGNDARGLNALGAVAGGHNNIAHGTNALGRLQFGRSNVAIGNDALGSLVGVNSTASAYGTPMGGADGNTAIGDRVLARLNYTNGDGGYENTGVGFYNLLRARNTRWNVAVGGQSQLLNETGEANVTLGWYNLTKTNARADNNIAIGFAALEEQQSGSNVAIGHVCMNGNLTGTRNVAIGPLVLERCQTGVDNVAVGQEALKNAVTAEGNTAIGAYALGQITTGGSENNTALGHNALLTFSSGALNTALGAGALATASTITGSTGVGANSAVTGSNQVQLGASGTTTYAYGAVQDRSDIRDKADVRDTVLGLSFIQSLRPVDFRWDMRDDYRVNEKPPAPPELINPRRNSENYEADRAADDAAMAAYRATLDEWCERQQLSNVVRDGSKKRQRYHHGLIAQEVQSVIEDSGVDFGGFQHHAVNGGDDVMSIGYEELIAPLIKAVQELSAKVEALEART